MKIVLIVLGALVLGFIVLIIMAKRRMKNIPTVKNHDAIVTLNDKNFNQQLKGRVMLVDFWADWCAPCKMMAPILNDVAEELKDTSTRVGKIDVERYQSIAQRYKIRGIPTLIIFKDGKEMNRIVGVKQKNAILNELKKY
ncbi:MAG: thioredoxin [Petrimonas sp.]|nr:thioredoxin [Petrimonas sp.]